MWKENALLGLSEMLTDTVMLEYKKEEKSLSSWSFWSVWIILVTANWTVTFTFGMLYTCI